MAELFGMVIGFIVMMIVLAAFMLYSTFAWAFVVSKFYVWFILVNFKELPAINYMAFLGIMLFLKVLLPKDTTDIKEEFRSQKKGWLRILFAPWIVLFFGYLFKIIFF